jgi:hypothetical protein
MEEENMHRLGSAEGCAAVVAVLKSFGKTNKIVAEEVGRILK